MVIGQGNDDYIFTGTGFGAESHTAVMVHAVSIGLATNSNIHSFAGYGTHQISSDFHKHI